MKHKEEFITEEKVINTPAGGVLIGRDKDGQTIIPNDGSLGGFLVGRLHKDGGIKAINKGTGQPLEMQSNEIVITAPAVADTKKHNFNGKMMTNREILSKINSDGGGVSFADGGDIPAKINTTDCEYKLGGKVVKDTDIAHSLGMNSTLKKGKQQFYSGGMTYDVDAIYNAIKKGKLRLKTKEVETFPMKYPVYDKKYSETVKTDFRKPNGITVRTRSGEEVLIDGNHRMNNAYLKGKKTMKTYYIEDPKQIAKFTKKNKFELGGENKVGGHLSSGKSLKQIAQMHNVSLAHVNEELAKGLEVEKEHFADFKERTRVAKDHLVENPNYYTLLSKAGLKMGGHIQRQELVEKSKKGDTPARDLNNYNDVMDLEADGMVGGDSGLAFAKGGVVYDTTKPTVDKITIKETKFDGDSNLYSGLRENIVGKEATNISYFINLIKDYVGQNPLEETDWLTFYVNDGKKGTYYIDLNKGKKNTVKNVNPKTGGGDDIKRVIDANKYLAKNYNWTEFFYGQQTKKDNSVIKISVTYDSKVQVATGGLALKNNTLELYEFLRGLHVGEYVNVQIQPIGNSLGVNPVLLNLNTFSWDNLLTMSPQETALKEINRILYGLFPELNFDDFIKANSNSTTSTPASTSTQPLNLSNTKVWLGEDYKSNLDLIKKIQEKAFELGWGWAYNGADKAVKDIQAQAFYFDEYNVITYSSAISGRSFYDMSGKDQITVEELLGSQTPISSQANTSTQPFDFYMTKIDVSNNSDLSLRVQKKAFEDGWEWENGGGKTIDYNSFNYLYFTKTSISYGNTNPSFVNSPKREITEAEIFGNSAILYKDNSVDLVRLEYQLGKNYYDDKRFKTGEDLLEDFAKIEFYCVNNPDAIVSVLITAEVVDKIGKITSKTERIDIGKNALKPSNFSYDEIKELIQEKWFNNQLDFSIFFKTNNISQTPTTNSVVPKTVENSVYNLDLAIQKLEKASSSVVIEYNKEIYDQSLKFLYDTKSTYELALKFTPESAFMYERLDIMKKLADIEKQIKNIEDMKKGGTFYMLTKILEKLERGENWRQSESADDVITNAIPQSEIDVIIRSQKFKNWFGDWEKALINDEYDNVSKALTDGIPSVYHHGARRIKYTYREVSNGVLYLAENVSYAIWFSQNATAQSEEGNYLTECFVNVKNPIDLTAFKVNQVDLGDIVRYVDAIYPMAKIYDYIPAQVALLIKTNQPTNVRMWAWQLIRKYAKFVNHIKENTPYDGFLYYENNPSDQVVNPATGQSEENVTKAVAIFKSHQVKIVDAVLFDGGLDDWRFENGGKIKN